MRTGWKTLSREERLFGDRPVTVLYHALYSDSCDGNPPILNLT
jgi:hypothetical protein